MMSADGKHYRLPKQFRPKEGLVMEKESVLRVKEFLNKLAPRDALEVKLELLNLLLPFCKDNVDFAAFLSRMRDELLGR